MKTLLLSLAAYGGAVALTLSPWSAANAQMVQTDPAPATVAHGDWTLGQREDWLNSQLEKSVAAGSLDRGQFNSARLEMDQLRHDEAGMRQGADGQLTGNQTRELEARLDTMSDKIHWANMSAYKRPW